MESPSTIWELDEEPGLSSSGSLSILAGNTLAIRQDQESADTQRLQQLQLSPDRPAIIGRANGYEVPYLDPAYRPRTTVPGTGQCVLHSGGDHRDTRVSRGHFMLKAARSGILFVNGVPRCGGGIRPPLNGTLMLSPTHRTLDAGEEYLIESGQFAVIELPNGSQVLIAAE
jgi:hypothetical protein